MTALTAVATDIALRLCASASWRGDQCGWTVDGDDASAGGDLYGGAAGVAWFLAQAAMTTDEPIVARTAIGAACGALDWVEDRHRRPAPGLFGGDIGALWGVAEVGTLLGADDLTRRASGHVGPIADRLLADVHARCDVVGGLAGTVLGILAFGEDRVPGSTELAVRAGRHLVAMSRPSLVGRSWPVGPSGSATVGLGHGASGVAAALLELVRVTGDPQFLAAARDGLRFEAAWFDRRLCSWRDPTSSAPAGISWCRGAAGIGLARLRAIDVVGDPRVTAEAGAALALVHSRIARPITGSEGPDSSVCHGMMGAADVLAYAATVTGATAHRRAAQDLAARLAVDALRTGRWACGTLDHRETPGLMLGIAGIGATLLRIDRPGLGPVGLPGQMTS